MSTCPIHEDAPNPNCKACNAGEMTDTEKINRIRGALQDKANAGMLGPIAAMANIWGGEGRLRKWCDDPAEVPTYAELMTLQNVLKLGQLFDPQEDLPDDDPKIGDDYRGGGG